MNPFLPQNEALVFYGNTTQFRAEDWLSALSETEMTRTKSISRTADRQQYIISRGVLKRLLSGFLSVAEQEIALQYGKNGKPSVAGHPELQFNSSHSGEAFVIGFVRGREIGVDVEPLDRPVNRTKLQSWLFTPAELTAFLALDEHDRQEAFIHSWTRKEAVLKASGDGLAHPMNTLELSHVQASASWFLESRTLPENYRMAVAVKGTISGIRYTALSPELLFPKAG